MTGNFITIHKETKYLGQAPPDPGVINTGGSRQGRLCNPYDEDQVTTQFNLEVTCKSCLKILKSQGVPEFSYENIGSE